MRLFRKTLKRTAPLLVAVAIGAAAVNLGGSDAQPALTSSTALGEPQTAALQLEGEEVMVSATTATSPSEWPLQFSTVVPEPFQVETSVDEMGYRTRFVWNYPGSQPDPAPAFQVYVFDSDVTEDQVREHVTAIAQRLNLSQLASEDKAYPQADVEYARAASGHTARLSAGQNGDVMWYILTQYPSEYGDGFGPRQHLILNSWHWAGQAQGFFAAQNQ